MLNISKRNQHGIFIMPLRALNIFAVGWDIYPWPSHLTWPEHGIETPRWHLTPESHISSGNASRRAPGECRGSQLESSWSQSLPGPSRGKMILSKKNWVDEKWMKKIYMFQWLWLLNMFFFRQDGPLYFPGVLHAAFPSIGSLGPWFKTIHTWYLFMFIKADKFCALIICLPLLYLSTWFSACRLNKFRGPIPHVFWCSNPPSRTVVPFFDVEPSFAPGTSAPPPGPRRARRRRGLRPRRPWPERENIRRTLLIMIMDIMDYVMIIDNIIHIVLDYVV